MAKWSHWNLSSKHCFVFLLASRWTQSTCFNRCASCELAKHGALMCHCSKPEPVATQKPVHVKVHLKKFFRSFKCSDRANNRHAFIVAAMFLFFFFLHIAPLHIEHPEVGNDIITTSKLPLTRHHGCSISSNTYRVVQILLLHQMGQDL